MKIYIFGAISHPSENFKFHIYVHRKLRMENQEKSNIYNNHSKEIGEKEFKNLQILETNKKKKKEKKKLRSKNIKQPKRNSTKKKTIIQSLRDKSNFFNSS